MLAMTGALFVIKPGFSGKSYGAMAAGAYRRCWRRPRATLCTYARLNSTAVIVFILSLQLLAMVPLIVLKYHAPDEPIPDPHASLCRLCCCRRSVQHRRCMRYALQRNLSLRLFAIIFTTALGFKGVRSEIPDIYSFIGYAIIITAGTIIFFK